jgi:uncharacterized protein YuzE
MMSTYDQEEDILNIQLKENEYWKSIELADGVILDISKKGEVTAIEILNASKVFSGDGERVLNAAHKTAA